MTDKKKKTTTSIKRFFEIDKVDTIFHYVIMFILFYVQTDAMLFSLNEKTRIVEFLILALVFVICLFRALVCKKITFFHNKGQKQFVILIVLFLISFVANSYNTFNIHRYLIQISNLFLSYLIVLSLDLNKLKRAFITTIVFFSFMSLLFYVPYYFNENIFSFLPKITNASGYNYYFCGFNFLFLRTSSGFVRRNYGIFREPGVYGVFLISALILLLFSQKTKKRIIIFPCVIIIVLTIITTLSTTTLISLFIVFIAKMFSKKSRPFINALKIVFVVFMLSFGTIVLFFPNVLSSIPILYNVFGKFNFGNSSFVSRFFDSIMTVLVFLINPLFGVGFGGLHAHLHSISSAFNSTTNGGINSLFQLFAVHGLFFGLICSYFIYRFFKVSFKVDGVPFALTVASFLICIFNEDLCNSLFFFLAISIGMINVIKVIERADYCYVEI